MHELRNNQFDPANEAPEPTDTIPAKASGNPVGSDGRDISKPAAARSPLRLPLDPAFLLRGQVTLRQLNDASPDAGPDERILHQLAADEVAIAAALGEAQAQLASRLLLLLDDPTKLVLVSRALKDVTYISNAITKRVEGALGAAANLRAQRRFFASHARGHINGF